MDWNNRVALGSMASRMIPAAIAAVVLNCSAFAGSEEPTSGPPNLTNEATPVSPTANEGPVLATLRLGIWGMSLDGETSVRQYASDFSADFGDLIKNTNYALMPAFELEKDKWTFAFNGLLTQLEDETSFNSTLPSGTEISGGANTILNMAIADAALGYRLWDIPLDGESNKTLSITPAVGVRYTYLSVEVDPYQQGSRERSKSLVDPYIGGRLSLRLSDAIAWRTDATIGGFGAGSELTWSAQTFIDWRFHDNWELNVGYRAMYWDYEDGDLELNTTMHGPWVGISFCWD